MPSDCYACRLIEGAAPLPGGRIHVTEHWVVEHCTGPLGVGTMIVKPFRHCLHVGEITPAEAQELGPLLQGVSQVVETAHLQSRGALHPGAARYFRMQGLMPSEMQEGI